MGLLDRLNKDALDDPVIVTESDMSDEENLEPPFDPAMIVEKQRVDGVEEEPLEDIGEDYDEVEVVTEHEDGKVEASTMSASSGKTIEARAAVRGRKRTVKPKWGVKGTVGPAPRFTWREVACNNGTALPAKYRKHAVKLAHAMNNMRGTIAKKYKVKPANVYITVNSWYRTPAYNASIGGVGNSTHTTGMAADITVYVKGRRGRMRRVPPRVVANHAELRAYFKKGGIGRYANFTHLDVRGYRARWSG